MSANDHLIAQSPSAAFCGTPTKLSTFPATTGQLSVTGQSLYNQTPYQWTQPYQWTYTYPNDARVTALEAEVKVLREMFAALLSGRDVAPRKVVRKKRS